MQFHVLNLGAGVQSTALYLLSREPGSKIRFDAAVFADTQEEPGGVYRHLSWLQSLGWPPIHVRTAGKLGDDLIHGRPGSGGFSSIPAFTAEDHRTRLRFCAGVKEGMVRRQCTHDFGITSDVPLLPRPLGVLEEELWPTSRTKSKGPG